MKSFTIATILAFFLSAFSICAFADADSPPGLMEKGHDAAKGLLKNDKTPPGWSKGKKKGWNKNLKSKQQHLKDLHKGMDKTLDGL